MTVVLQATDKLVGMLGKVRIRNTLTSNICQETVITHERALVYLIVESCPWQLAVSLHLCLRMGQAHCVKLRVILLLHLLYHLERQYLRYVDWRLLLLLL